MLFSSVQTAPSYNNCMVLIIVILIENFQWRDKGKYSSPLTNYKFLKAPGEGIETLIK